MESEQWPFDPEAIAMRVPDLIREIDEAGDEELFVLLNDLLCTAWGSSYAQNQ